MPAVCFHILTEHTQMHCVGKTEFLDVKPGGTCNNHWPLKG